MTVTLTTAQTITILKHLAAGRQPDFVAQVTHQPQNVIEHVAERYNWPDQEALRKAIFDLSRNEQLTPSSAPTHMAPAATTSAPRPDLSVARTAPAPAPAAVERPRTVSSSAAELLHMASESHLARTRNLGKKISGLLADLSQRLNDEEAEHLARVAAEQEKAKNAKRIAELEAELAKLKGRKPKTPKAADPDKPKRTNIAPKGHYPCDTCDRVLDTPQGKAAHQRRAHEGFSPAAVHQQSA